MSLDLNAIGHVYKVLENLERLERKQRKQRKMGRGFNWSAEEEVAACRAALSVSECAVVGANQRHLSFEERGHKEFLSLVPASASKEGRERWLSRSQRAVLKQWKAIRASCIKFYSKMEIVTAAELSGEPTTEDLWRVALMLYNKMGLLSQAYETMNDPNFDIGPAFPHKAAYNYLKSTGILENGVLVVEDGDGKGGGSGRKEEREKNWRQDVEDPRRAEQVTAAGNEGAKKEDPIDATQVARRKDGRPVGNKLAKEIKAKEVSLMRMASSYATMASTGKERVRIRSEQLLLEKQQYALSLFSQPGTDPAVRRRFLQLAQKRALEELEDAGENNAKSRKGSHQESVAHSDE